jgi:hypothetical protein
LRPAVVFTSDSESEQKRNKVVNRRALIKKQVTYGVKHNKPSDEPFLGATGLNMVIDNPESVDE